ncbi:hypothetical protein A5719_00265 [Mycolicibacterium peregrinum]|uniref:hypothetical protein n=1 Tax=Mycolicibacterium peregrinum TaxID=43304 RepID=UPI0007E9D19B|nr:hypothetical protein [Mycolicibacterium peregrinum]OBF45968.1 hypothetical protein A5719_00265 [Mycolicibacterium peregrinum]
MGEEIMAPGWYLTSSGRHAYWDGQKWLPDEPAPISAPDDQGISRSKAVAVGVLILSGIGLVMSMQSASLLTGTGSIWTGVALAGAGAAAAFFLGAPKWARIVAIVILVLALFSAGYMEKQISDKRNEISHMFDSSP